MPVRASSDILGEWALPLLARGLPIGEDCILSFRRRAGRLDPLPGGEATALMRVAGPDGGPDVRFWPGPFPNSLQGPLRRRSRSLPEEDPARRTSMALTPPMSRNVFKASRCGLF